MYLSIRYENETKPPTSLAIWWSDGLREYLSCVLNSTRYTLRQNAPRLSAASSEPRLSAKQPLDDLSLPERFKCGAVVFWHFAGLLLNVVPESASLLSQEQAVPLEPEIDLDVVSRCAKKAEAISLRDR